MNYLSPHHILLGFGKRRHFHSGISLAGIMTFSFFALSPAAADFRLCNNTSDRVGVALGHKERKDWSTTGWWTVGPNKCETLLAGRLASRYFYVHAVDYDGNGVWLGKAFMCTNSGTFAILGAENCIVRGYNRSGFFEVDTQDKRDWTINLDETMISVPSIPQHETR